MTPVLFKRGHEPLSLGLAVYQRYRPPPFPKVPESQTMGYQHAAVRHKNRGPRARCPIRSAGNPRWCRRTHGYRWEGLSRAANTMGRIVFAHEWSRDTCQMGDKRRTPLKG